MTRAQFEAVPCVAREDWRHDIKDFDSLVILPTRRMHDSGYRAMYFVACKGNNPIVKLSGGSDVIHINGIGGFGYKWSERYVGCPSAIPPVAWSIDCLKVSGLLRLFVYGNLIAESGGYSSFELFADPEKTVKTNENAQSESNQNNP